MTGSGGRLPGVDRGEGGLNVWFWRKRRKRRRRRKGRRRKVFSKVKCG